MELRAWRERQVTEMDLPSGLTVKLKPVSLVDLMINGEIPAPLLSQVQTLIDSKSEVELSKIGDYMETINLAVKACVISPPLADEPDEDHLSVSELPLDDRMAIFNFANQAAESLKPFRSQPAGDDGATQPGAGVQSTAEPDRGD